MSRAKRAKQPKPARRPPAIRTVADLIPDDRNANVGTERGMTLLEQSLRDCGAGRSILADRKGRIIAGNKTAEAAGPAGLEDVEVVQTDGAELVVVQRTDLDLQTDPKAKSLAILDNRVGQLNLRWDGGVLQALAGEIDLTAAGFAPDELTDLVAGDAAPAEVGQDENSLGNITPSDTQARIGELTFPVTRDEYFEWLERVRKQVGMTPGAIKAAILERLGL